MDFLVKHGDGNLHEMMMLIRQAAVAAVISGAECIDLARLHEAQALPDMEEIDHVDDDL